MPAMCPLNEASCLTSMSADKKRLESLHDSSVVSFPHTSASLFPDTPNPLRRLIVGGVVASLTLVPAVTLMRPVFAAGASSGADAATTRAFADVSRYLIGERSLDPTQTSRLLQALLDDDAGFGAACQQLAAYLTANKPDPLHLQADLDAAKASYASLPRRIVTAWYVGVVGDGERARAITYTTSLMNRVVEDRLCPPSYAYGGYGAWRVDPRTVSLSPLVAPAAARV